MVRALITISEKDLKKLDRCARQKKQSRAAIMREALGLYLKTKGKMESWGEIVHKTASMWKHKKIDGVEYTNKLKAEWER
jgi:metal-responsive CopG/Arc/MetJ family transcriptional regulator